MQHMFIKCAEKWDVIFEGGGWPYDFTLLNEVRTFFGMGYFPNCKAMSLQLDFSLSHPRPRRTATRDRRARARAWLTVAANTKIESLTLIGIL